MHLHCCPVKMIWKSFVCLVIHNNTAEYNVSIWHVIKWTAHNWHWHSFNSASIGICVVLFAAVTVWLYTTQLSVSYNIQCCHFCSAHSLRFNCVRVSLYTTHLSLCCMLMLTLMYAKTQTIEIKTMNHSIVYSSTHTPIHMHTFTVPRTLIHSGYVHWKFNTASGEWIFLARKTSTEHQVNARLFCGRNMIWRA